MVYPIKPTPPPRSNNHGFTLIEVLIATLIMVLSIVTVTAAIRQFSLQRLKLVEYEAICGNVLSLRDNLMNRTLSNNLRESGKLNGSDYHFHCSQVESSYSYVYDAEMGGGTNTGYFIITLYKIKLETEGKEFEFFKTQYKKRPGIGEEF